MNFLPTINWKDEFKQAFAWKLDEKQREKNRIDYIDLAKGICIFLVVLHHALLNYDIRDYPSMHFFQMFRMPLYFLLSGLFFKQYEGFFGFMKRKINKLLIPYIAFSLITLLMPYHNRAIWFLLCLFILNIFFYAIFEIAEISEKKYSQKAKIIVIVALSIIAGIIGFYLCKQRILFKTYIPTALVAIPFFGLGFVMRKYTKILNNSKYDKFMWILAIPLFFITWICQGRATFLFGIFELSLISLYIGGFAGILAILFIAKSLHRLPILSYCGRYSIIILVTHLFVLKFALKRVISIFTGMGMKDYVAVAILSVILMLAYVFIIPLVKTYMPHITAQKDVIPINTN